MNSPESVNFVLKILNSIEKEHNRASTVYKYLDELLKRAILDLYGERVTACAN